MSRYFDDLTLSIDPNVYLDTKLFEKLFLNRDVRYYDNLYGYNLEEINAFIIKYEREIKTFENRVNTLLERYSKKVNDKSVDSFENFLNYSSDFEKLGNYFRDMKTDYSYFRINKINENSQQSDLLLDIFITAISSFAVSALFRVGKSLIARAKTRRLFNEKSKVLSLKTDEKIKEIEDRIANIHIRNNDRRTNVFTNYEVPLSDFLAKSEGGKTLFELEKKIKEFQKIKENPKIYLKRLMENIDNNINTDNIVYEGLFNTADNIGTNIINEFFATDPRNIQLPLKTGELTVTEEDVYPSTGNFFVDSAKTIDYFVADNIDLTHKDFKAIQQWSRNFGHKIINYKSSVADIKIFFEKTFKEALHNGVSPANEHEKHLFLENLRKSGLPHLNELQRFNEILESEETLTSSPIPNIHPDILSIIFSCHMEKQLIDAVSDMQIYMRADRISSNRNIIESSFLSFILISECLMSKKKDEVVNFDLFFDTLKSLIATDSNLDIISNKIFLSLHDKITFMPSNSTGLLSGFNEISKKHTFDTIVEYNNWFKNFKNKSIESCIAEAVKTQNIEKRTSLIKTIPNIFQSSIYTRKTLAGVNMMGDIVEGEPMIDYPIVKRFYIAHYLHYLYLLSTRENSFSNFVTKYIGNNN